ncbi:MAG: hydroxymethylglutaryl-CoA synthase family protein [Peptococcaceae bacterium]
MVGIKAYGAYVPFNRLERKKIGEVFGERGMPGEKAVANYDEDSVTMAATAALDCLTGLDPAKVDGLYFATTSATYKEKLAATTIAGVTDLRKDVRTADFTDSMRAGSTALLTALDAVAAGANSMLVCMADCRLGGANGALEQTFGDGGAAFLIGKEGVIAELIDNLTISSEFIDYWRGEKDTFVRSWEERFVITEGYNRLVKEAVTRLLKKNNLTPKDFNKIVLYGPAPRHQAALAQMLGFDKEQVQDNLYSTVGIAGVANAPMMLVGALEDAAPGDKVLFVTYGEGSDALIFKVTDAIRQLPARRALRGYLEIKKSTMLYTAYLKWRKLIDLEPPRRPEPKSPSLPGMWRRYQQSLGLYGTKCINCGTPQFPVQRICTKCQAKDQMEPYTFKDKKATIATYTVDYLAASPDPPVIFAVVDFEGGGRMICEMTDSEVDKLDIGKEVEMSFRKIYDKNSIYVYGWKAMLKKEVG